MNRDRIRTARAAALAAALALAAAGCAPSEDDLEGPGEPGELRVLAGSELADMEPLLADAAEEIGVTVHMDYVGTLDGVDMVRSGATENRYDAVWFSSNRYLTLHADGRAALRAETPVMASPVVLGVTSSAAAELGWDEDAEVTWGEIADAAADGKLSYGMTSPAASNSGFTALVGIASALADTGSALESADVAEVAPELTEFFSGQELTAGSSGWLTEEYVRRAADGGLNAMVNYESVLLSLSESGELAEPLRIVRPADGVITADYPLSLLETASDEVAEGYDRLVEHLTAPGTQERISAETHRRPMAAVPQGSEAAQMFPPVTELPFPARPEVVDELVAAYFDEIRRPARTVYVMDVSGSMQGDRIDGLRDAMHTLTGGGTDSTAGRYQRFYEREEVTLLPFDTVPHPPMTFTIPPGNPAPVLDEIGTAVDGLSLGEATAAYDALASAYETLEEGGGEEDAFTSIVLLTDGEVNEGRDFAEFRDEVHAGLPEELRGVPVFTVLFGESDAEEMESLAELSGGRVFDARETSLVRVFREIRGYQ
ncbi:vWA domain-containing protein [Actinorugispora endophytica]|uniref:Ca-activated chloride channel family protein n=1 Tax=Actinorugispora endophytica TaxID=1605990 RepID=A0A4R6V412_9ACTN|nr:VWA domain-containing protein [Actinorugispora endophytica]TDQ55031.1 Ca-activated chloride channel family protein [Actinorugispora endophytica]